MNVKRQSGSVLAISLVILTAITLISITSLQRSGIQTRIVTNVQHDELLFNQDQAYQALWISELRKNETGDDFLAAALKKFTQDEVGIKTYSAVALTQSSLTSLPGMINQNIISAANILYVPHEPAGDNDIIALAEGEEAGQRINFLFTLNTQTRIQGATRSKSQASGLTFPGLNASLHTAYAP
jgi:hypothetical protein